MSGLEVPAFLVGLAGLFSACVDAFGYFKLAQHANEAIEVVLLKLDIEKTRLLIWGENIGIFSASGQNPQLLDERVVDVVRRILIQVQSLLTDSEKLRTSCGVPNLDTSLEKAVDYISRKSHAVFQTSASRFWTRNSSKLSAVPQRSTIARIKWAVYEKEKFQDLVNDLSNLVDSLYELIIVAREIQDRIIIEDIESMVDISHLAIIEEATEGSHRAYSQAAASTKSLTEAGTVDRRTLEERLRDTEGTEKTNFPNTHTTSNSVNLDLLVSEVKQCETYFVLTSKCRKLQTQNPCVMRDLGSQAADIPTYGTGAQWDISSKNPNGGNTLWQLIERMIGVREEIEHYENETVGEVLKAQDLSLTDAQRAYMSHRLPLLSLFIYCAPCVCLIHTALSLSKRLSSPFLKIQVRPDDRLASSCCAEVDRTLGLATTLEQVREWESKADESETNYLASFLDSVWLDRRLDHLKHEQLYRYEERATASIAKRVLVIGEADYLATLVQKAPGRIPIPMDIWELNIYSIRPTRSLFGRFIESQFISSHLAPQTPMSSSLTPDNIVIQQQVQGDTSRVRRSSSTLYSDGKRQKSDNGSVEVGSRGVPNEDEDMEDGHGR